jgi:hypothetical protein
MQNIKVKQLILVIELVSQNLGDLFSIQNVSGFQK